MASNVGKVFEENFKKSVPDNMFCYRPPDQSQAFDIDNNAVGKKSKLRFSRHSPCDYMVFDGNFLYCLELKSVAGSSISFEHSKEEKGRGVIHYYQVDSLNDFAKKDNVYSGFLLDFRGIDKTYYLSIEEFNKLISNINKKSFTVGDMLKYCSSILIDKRKLKVNYRYDVCKLFEDINNSNIENNGLKEN